MMEILISDNAKEDIELITKFLKNKFSNKVRLEFLLRLSQKL